MKTLLTVEDASKLLRLSKSKIHHLTAARKIPHYKLGGKLVFDEERLWRWVEEQEVALD